MRALELLESFHRRRVRDADFVRRVRPGLAALVYAPLVFKSNRLPVVSKRFRVLLDTNAVRTVVAGRSDERATRSNGAKWK